MVLGEPVDFPEAICTSLEGPVVASGVYWVLPHACLVAIAFIFFIVPALHVFVVTEPPLHERRWCDYDLSISVSASLLNSTTPICAAVGPSAN